MKLNYTNGLREKDGEPWYFTRVVSLINSVDSWTTALLKWMLILFIKTIPYSWYHNHPNIIQSSPLFSKYPCICSHCNAIPYPFLVYKIIQYFQT